MRYLCLAISVLAVPWAAGCGRAAPTAVKVFHAGSLSAPFQELERLFERQNPGVDIQREAYGSAAAVRQVTELDRPAGVIGSADYRLIDQLMVGSEPAHADWNVLFARNSVGLAYMEGTPAPSDADWSELLLDEDVRVGMSNPNLDPCGYRSLCCCWLGQEVMGKDGLFDGLVLANANVSVTAEGDTAVIEVPEHVRYTGRLVMRPKETDLLALLETGAIDYVFIYRSVARQHELGFYEPPEEVNLSSAALAEPYAQVAVRQFADRAEQATLIGASPIVYGATVPRAAPHPEEAQRFVQLLLSEEGRRILRDNGQPPLVPPVLSPASREHAVPTSISRSLEQEAPQGDA